MSATQVGSFDQRTPTCRENRRLGSLAPATALVLARLESEVAAAVETAPVVSEQK